MRLRFDRFRFDRGEHRLEDASGAVDLNPKAFEVLAVLLQHRGQLVSKDALLDAVWTDAHVADGVLKVSIAELRRALGDSATTPRFIETVHRRGYRFIANAESLDDAGPAPTSKAADPARSLLVWPNEQSRLPGGRSPRYRLRLGTSALIWCLAVIRTAAKMR